MWGLWRIARAGTTAVCKNDNRMGVTNRPFLTLPARPWMETKGLRARKQVAGSWFLIKEIFYRQCDRMERIPRSAFWDYLTLLNQKWKPLNWLGKGGEADSMQQKSLFVRSFFLFFPWPVKVCIHTTCSTQGSKSSFIGFAKHTINYWQRVGSSPQIWTNSHFLSTRGEKLVVWIGPKSGNVWLLSINLLLLPWLAPQEIHSPLDRPGLKNAHTHTQKPHKLSCCNSVCF